ncbi:MAG: DNA adenine methylase [Prevotella sp.]|nr:DNA adenine methylase [Prevotella sp.]
MKYGLPYKGSKNRLAEHIVRLMPRAEHLIDLFCGGCAVSHAAMLTGKYPHVHINDCDWRPVTLFMDVLEGRYQDDTRWISREDFFRLKDTDPYVAIVWSFGNNMRDYLYSRDIEPLKRAIHYAIFYGDYKPAAELGHDLSFIDVLNDTRRKYIAVKRYFEQFGHFQQQSFEGGQSHTNRLEHYERSVCKASNRGGVQLLSQTTSRVPAHREPTLHTTDCSTESGIMRCLTIRGGKTSLRVFRTMPMWIFQRAA